MRKPQPSRHPPIQDFLGLLGRGTRTGRWSGGGRRAGQAGTCAGRGGCTTDAPTDERAHKRLRVAAAGTESKAATRAAGPPGPPTRAHAEPTPPAVSRRRLAHLSVRGARPGRSGMNRRGRRRRRRDRPAGFNLLSSCRPDGTAPKPPNARTPQKQRHKH